MALVYDHLWIKSHTPRLALSTVAYLDCYSLIGHTIDKLKSKKVDPHHKSAKVTTK